MASMPIFAKPCMQVGICGTSRRKVAVVKCRRVIRFAPHASCKAGSCLAQWKIFLKCIREITPYWVSLGTRLHVLLETTRYHAE